MSENYLGLAENFGRIQVSAKTFFVRKDLFPKKIFLSKKNIFGEKKTFLAKKNC